MSGADAECSRRNMDVAIIPYGTEEYDGYDSPLFRAIVIEDSENSRSLLEGGASVKSYFLTDTAHLNAEIMRQLVTHGLMNSGWTIMAAIYCTKCCDGIQG